MEDEKFKWIPWKRYVFILNMDGKDYFLGRYRRREGLIHRMDDLNRYAGYKARIIDTKKAKKCQKR